MSNKSTPPRPSVTPEMVRQVTDKLCERHEIGDPDVLPKHYRYPMDGLELAIELAKNEGWEHGHELDQGLVDEFDGIDAGVRKLIEEAEREWFEANEIEPPLPIMSYVKYRQFSGILVDIYKYGVGKYLLKLDEGQLGTDTQLIVNFEDVELAEVEGVT